MGTKRRVTMGSDRTHSLQCRYAAATFACLCEVYNAENHFMRINNRRITYAACVCATFSFSRHFQCLKRLRGSSARGGGGGAMLI